jgi:hypothetical protein
MSNANKNILITPNRNDSGIPEISLTGFGASTISIRVPDDNTGTVEFTNSGTTLFSIDSNQSATRQLSIGSSVTGSLLDVNQIGDVVIRTQKNIISGTGLKLPKIQSSNSSSVKGKIAYNSDLKTLVVNNSKTWITYGPNQESYVENGLILNYDPSRRDSYPGSGSAVYDISGSSVGSGELTGSMTNVGFSTDRGGAFVFNGSNSYIDVNNSSDLLRDFSGYTVEWYVRITQNVSAEIFGNYGSGYTSGRLWISARYGHYLNTSNPYFTSTTYTAAAPLPSTYTYHAAVTRDPQTRNIMLYLNGVLNNSSTADTRIENGINYRIGADVNGGAEPFGGNLYVIRVYNRPLTPKEIQMNFNATRNRVGL